MVKQAYKLIVHIFESQGLAQHDKFMIAAERWQSIAHDDSEYEHEGMAIEAQARGMGRKYNYRCDLVLLLLLLLLLLLCACRCVLTVCAQALAEKV